MKHWLSRLLCDGLLLLSHSSLSPSADSCPTSRPYSSRRCRKSPRSTNVCPWRTRSCCGNCTMETCWPVPVVPHPPPPSARPGTRPPSPQLHPYLPDNLRADESHLLPWHRRSSSALNGWRRCLNQSSVGDWSCDQPVQLFEIFCSLWHWCTSAWAEQPPDSLSPPKAWFEHTHIHHTNLQTHTSEWGLPGWFVECSGLGSEMWVCVWDHWNSPSLFELWGKFRKSQTLSHWICLKKRCFVSFVAKERSSITDLLWTFDGFWSQWNWTRVADVNLSIIGFLVALHKLLTTSTLFFLLHRMYWTHTHTAAAASQSQGEDVRASVLLRDLKSPWPWGYSWSVTGQMFLSC